MMNTNHIDQLIELLATKQISSQDIPNEIIRGIARNPTALVELDLLSTALTGEVATLKADAERFAAEQMDVELLGAYVDAQMAGAEAATLYPTIAHRIQNDASFRTEYETLLALLQAEDSGYWVKSPGPLSFVELQQQQAPTTATGDVMNSPLWQTVGAGVNRLLSAIPILVAKSTARFGHMAAPLTPALVPAGVYRARTNASDREKQIEALTLPSQAGLNWTPQVRLGPVENGRVTLILLVNMLTPPEPISQAKVLLCDADGNLLESIATDEKGLVSFEGLELGTYQLEVEYNGQVEQFPISLTSQDA